MIDVLRGIDVVCHQAAVVGAGIDADDARPTPVTTISEPPSSWPRCTEQAARDWFSVPRWLFTVTAATATPPV